MGGGAGGGPNLYSNFGDLKNGRGLPIISKVLHDCWETYNQWLGWRDNQLWTKPVPARNWPGPCMSVVQVATILRLTCARLWAGWPWGLSIRWFSPGWPCTLHSQGVSLQFRIEIRGGKGLSLFGLPTNGDFIIEAVFGKQYPEGINVEI